MVDSRNVVQKMANGSNVMEDDGEAIDGQRNADDADTRAELQLIVMLMRII